MFHRSKPRKNISLFIWNFILNDLSAPYQSYFPDWPTCQLILFFKNCVFCSVSQRGPLICVNPCWLLQWNSKHSIRHLRTESLYKTPVLHSSQGGEKTFQKLPKPRLEFCMKRRGLWYGIMVRIVINSYCYFVWSQTCSLSSSALDSWALNK